MQNEPLNSRLRRLRTTRDYTQQELADAIGKSKGLISLLESGEREFSEDIARQLAKFFGEDEEEWVFHAGPAQQIRKILRDYPQQTKLFIENFSRRKHRGSAYQKLREVAGVPEKGRVSRRS